uniref:epidermal growth factor receptor kinase substrate 8-like protein 3 isoform X2 n=1 Tax=Scatophagus argus TaxID=75038 RepID=UPI001ED809F4|nr:epidermal growth factor receptor kinase substrate 8-like protein 3 isoform X2 [Scatophagus argus]
MFRTNSPFGNDTSSYADSIQSNGYSTMDERSSQISNLSRPSAKSIYLQRKEYAESINKIMDKFQYRVEHLFTCDLDGNELRDVADCVERLKLLDGMGRVWGQSMLLEVRGPKLLLTDIETKMELESIALRDVLELKAVVDSEVFNSLLTVSVQASRKHTTTVFMFQCEDIRADLIQKDLSRALSRRNPNNAGHMDGHQGMSNHRNAAKSSEPKEQNSMPQWAAPDYEEYDIAHPEEEEQLSLQPFMADEEPPPPYKELDRNIDILNHILNDLEIFMGQIAAVVAKNANKKKKKKKGKVTDSMPPAADFATCLQKIKCGFNLLVELNGKITNPGVPEFIHSLFSTLAFVVSHCPEDLPPTIVAPLLTPQCIRLMSEEASTEEDQLWQSLGDAWNIPSTQWPEEDEDIPTYTLEFFDGWQPPEVSATPEPIFSEPVRRQVKPSAKPEPVFSEPVTRQVKPSAKPEPVFSEPVTRQVKPSAKPEPVYSEPVRRQESPQPSFSQASAKWRPSYPPQKASSDVSKPRSKPQHMRVKYDFISRNNRELSIRKGEIVELLDKSKQWWNVRNSRGEEGFVPNNVLEDNDEQPIQQTVGPPVLTKRSKPAEVKAWLEDKDFSKITVRCLGGLSGPALLGMTREELKTVCPEEGGRVFIQLQAVKSAMAAAT